MEMVSNKLSCLSIRCVAHLAKRQLELGQRRGLCSLQHRRSMFAHAAPVAAQSPTWDYEEKGPRAWPVLFPAGQGPHQSPINIDTTEQWTKFDSGLRDLRLDYSRSRATSIVNNGYSFQVNFSLDHPTNVSGGPLDGDYQLVEFHGHWGKSNKTHGSEHTINGRSYPAELQFVHFNRNKYGTTKEAIKHKDGIAIISAFLKVHPEERQHEEMQRVVDNIKHLDATADEVPLHTAIDPIQLLTTNLDHYFTYQGSLTIPPLTECVTWLVMAHPILVSSRQLNQLKFVQRPCDHRAISSNYRPVMPINKRQVSASFLNYSNRTTDGPISAA